MGIETATLAAIGSLLGGGAAVFSAISGGKGKTPEVPALEKPPTEAKVPDVNVFKDRNQQGMRGQSGAATLLAPMGGVPNSTLNLGRNTLLGA